MKDESSPLAQLKNLGETSARWLNEIGIDTAKDLAELGSVGAYRLLKARGHNVTLNLVYAIEAALLDMHWTTLPRELKDRLKTQCRERAMERPE